MFQSTLPTRGSDIKAVLTAIRAKVSIHAPHEGERPIPLKIILEPLGFQSTLPTRGSDYFM